MPIQRPSEREQLPSALDVFTDREELIAAFERNLEQKQPQDHRVLVLRRWRHRQDHSAAEAGAASPPALSAGVDGASRLGSCRHHPAGSAALPAAAAVPCHPLSPFSPWRWRNTAVASIRSRCMSAIAKSCCRGPGPRPMCSPVGSIDWSAERGGAGRQRHEGRRYGATAPLRLGLASCRALVAA